VPRHLDPSTLQSSASKLLLPTTIIAFTEQKIQLILVFLEAAHNDFTQQNKWLYWRLFQFERKSNWSTKMTIKWLAVGTVLPKMLHTTDNMTEITKILHLSDS